MPELYEVRATYDCGSVLVSANDLDQAVVLVAHGAEQLGPKILSYFAIQVGLSRPIIERYTDDWIVGIEDKTRLVRKLHKPLQGGSADAARKFLPAERVYPTH